MSSNKDVLKLSYNIKGTICNFFVLAHLNNISSMFPKHVFVLPWFTMV